ncbi:MAG TPA: alanine--tRNA ligase-related protein [Candidatus Udaeobacter sp.]|nr:alanine--tRNA ligase-related protein [Candidatus Udaeobacter sp.]
MTSAQIRQSFLDFFREKQHTIVPSSSLLPDAPNLLFTNAGMNQFVPIFLGQQKPPWKPPRVADTQKCIRAGGKHNDLEDVGLDTYHHTFFEMLGNWSFGDYFKKEAIEWTWQLLVERWKFPAQRLYATVYKPGPGEPSEFDQEAHDHWARLFREADLDPTIHVLNGGKADNFWMMGDTGPCGPCSEVHVDLTPDGDTRGALVNNEDPRCIEIWNLVFIQFNAAADGKFTLLPARHVDTGMGFERVTAIIQGTKNFTDFSGTISNYETDIFRPIFDELEKLSSKKYGSTIPIVGQARRLPDTEGGSRSGRPTNDPEQEKIDIAFRVIADHIRALSFAIADGIVPSNEGRGYVLRRVLRRAVRYGRTLGFHGPFFFKLVDVVARTMGNVFPGIRAKEKAIKETIRREEEAFNKTLDKGIELFEREVTRILGSARGPRAVSGGAPETFPDTLYSKRNLPHFERPWAKYAITFTTSKRAPLSAEARQIVLDCLLYWNGRRYQLYAASVMPDHVHMLIEPQIKENDAKGNAIFFSLTEILHTIKSFTAHQINKLEKSSGPVWEKESFDRLSRSERDFQEKFQYITRNPWDTGIVGPGEGYSWVWWPEREFESAATTSRRAAEMSTPAACAPQTSDAQISGEFAFKLYDTYGFPLDLTELMARERGLTVDVAGFEKLMEQQRERARKAQKKEAISVEEGNLQVEPTKFLGYDFLETEAVIETVLPGKKPDELNIVLDRTPFYAEMGGQVGDHGLLHVPGHDRTEVGQLRVIDTQKRGDVFIHRAKLTEGRAPEPGEAVRVSVDVERRRAIQGHHTVTHLLHWALHEVVSRDAAQKGSYVGPDKLTFDFSSAALTKQQGRDVEKLVNEKIAENAPVSWTEIPYANVRKRNDVIQFFGEKYGDTVRVLQIGGAPHALNGYSMELCGGTHVRSTSEIGPFRIVKEEAIAAGIRRIEAVAGDAARKWAEQEAARQKEKFATVARKKPDIAELPVFESNADTAEMLKQIDARAAHLEKLESEVREWEKKSSKAAEAELKSRAAQIASELAASHAGKDFCVSEVPNADGKLLQAIVDALKPKFRCPIFLASASNGSVALVASVPKEMTSKFQANKIIQRIAPIVGGKGGGRPESAQGGGTDPSKVGEALAKAKELLS